MALAYARKVFLTFGNLLLIDLGSAKCGFSLCLQRFSRFFGTCRLLTSGSKNAKNMVLAFVRKVFLKHWNLVPVDLGVENCCFS